MSTTKTIKNRLDHAQLVCEQADESFTPLRAHIFEMMLKADGPVKAYDLLKQLEPDLGSPKPPTIYRALDFFSRLGLVHKVESLNAYIPCDHLHDGHSAEFFICTNCEKVQERHAHDHVNCVPDGFKISRSVIEHYGHCGNCKAA